MLGRIRPGGAVWDFPEQPETRGSEDLASIIVNVLRSRLALWNLPTSFSQPSRALHGSR